MFNEKDIEDFLMKDDNIRKVIEEDVTEIYRQVRLGSYGIADIITIYKEERSEADAEGRKRAEVVINIIELKMTESAGYNEIGQLLRYKTAIERFFELSELNSEYYVSVNCYLVCRGLAHGGDIHFLLNATYPNICVVEFKIDLSNGITFKMIGDNWARTEEGSLVKDLVSTFKIKKIDILKKAEEIINAKQ